MKQRQPKPPVSLSRFFVRFLSLVLAVLLLFMGTITALAYCDSSFSQRGEALRYYLGKAQALTQQIRIPGLIGGHATHILLIGQDSREGISSARADTVILCSISKEDSSITLTSFLRDLYLPIPGRGSHRLNAAYSLGGRKLLKKTLEKNFSLSIDGCVEVDFAHFPEIIDSLGGVNITLRADEAEYLNREYGHQLSAGENRLNGQQALGYSRIRKLDANGDFSRTQRQRTLLQSLFSSLRSVGPERALVLAKTVLPLVDTDLGTLKLTQLGMQLLPKLSTLEMHSQQIPQADSYQDKMIQGMAVLVPDMEKNRAFLQENLP